MLSDFKIQIKNNVNKDKKKPFTKQRKAFKDLY